MTAKFGVGVVGRMAGLGESRGPWGEDLSGSLRSRPEDLVPDPCSENEMLLPDGR